MRWIYLLVGFKKEADFPNIIEEVEQQDVTYKKYCSSVEANMKLSNFRNTNTHNKLLIGILKFILEIYLDKLFFYKFQKCWETKVNEKGFFNKQSRVSSSKKTNVPKMNLSMKIHCYSRLVL